MILVNDIFEDVTIDNAATVENGDLSLAGFSRISKRAELRLEDWVTGSVSDATPPAIYTTEKVRGWASPFSKQVMFNVENGSSIIPADFYMYETLAIKNSVLQADCETGVQSETDDADGTIEVLDAQVFDDRCKTYIERLRPSIERPIAKRVGNTFQYSPKDLGTIKLTYFRYPIFAKIVSKLDPVYNNEVIDENLSTNYEWGEYARELLVWFICDTYALKNRERALKELLNATGKSARG